MNKFLIIIILIFILIYLSNNSFIYEYFSTKIFNITSNCNNSNNNPNVLIPYYGPWYNAFLNYTYWNNYLPWNLYYPRFI